MVRKFFLAFFSAVLFNIAGHARNAGNQNPQYELGKNEISVIYGFLSVLDFTDGIDHHIHIQDCESALSSSMKRKTGAINVEYSYGLTPKIRMGLMASYMGYRHDVQYEHKYIGDFKSNYWGFLPMVQLYWFSHEQVAMYSKFAIGAAFNTRDMNSIDENTLASFDDANVQFEKQISPICFELGDRFRCFAELGFGNYLFSAGIKYYW